MAEANPLVSIMLVNWNTREMTLECLRSIYRETQLPAFEVIVVDNGSEDGSAKAIAQEFPQANLMAERENHGFAKATNLSVKQAKGDYILLLNTDTLVLEHAIDRLVKFAQDRPEAQIWGGRTLFRDRTLNPTSVWGMISPWSVTCRTFGLSAAFKGSQWLNPECYGDWDRLEEREVAIVQGAFFLTTKAFWDELGGFDPAFFMYGEEADLCARAHKLGARPRMTPEAQIVHYGGQSTQVYAQKIIYVLGGRIGLVNRHFVPFWRPFGRFMVAMMARTRSLAFPLLAALNGRFQDQADHWRAAWQRRGEWRHGPPSKPGD